MHPVLRTCYTARAVHEDHATFLWNGLFCQQLCLWIRQTVAFQSDRKGLCYLQDSVSPVWQQKTAGFWLSKVRSLGHAGNAKISTKVPVHEIDHRTVYFQFSRNCCLVKQRNVLHKVPRREAGDVWCLPPVWNLRAVIWFNFAIFSLVLLPSPVTLSVLAFSACWPFLLNFFQKILQYFSLRDRLFLYGSCLAFRRRQLVGGMCSMLPYDAGICCYAFI